MSKKRRPKTIVGMILKIFLMPFFFIIDYAIHFKPTPIIGRTRRRKRK